MKIHLLLLAACVFPAMAQDTRTVAEPAVPPVCVTLRAMLMAAPHLAAADEVALDTARIQKGIEGCTAGHAVELAANDDHNAFLSGPLRLAAGVTLLIDKGVTLFGTRDPKVYENSPGSCGIVNNEKAGCNPLVVADGVPGAAIMGEGTIDGRGGEKLLFAQPDGSLKAGPESWWDLANDARAGGRQQVPRLIEMDHSDNFTLYKITLKNSANFHVSYRHGDGLTVWGMKIDTPRNARNTDGLDPSASTNITVTQSFIRTGDDNIAIKGGDGPVTNMTVIHNHFYYGHGMSIGSETNAGVSKVLVSDLSLDGTDAGIRIKSNSSRGGLVHDIVYDDVCIRNSKAPISLTTDYTYPGKVTNLYPVYRDILLHNVRISGGGRIVMEAFNATHRIGIQLDGVLITDAAAYKSSIRFTDVIVGPGPENLPLRGTASTISGRLMTGELAGCSGMFVPFPAQDD